MTDQQKHLSQRAIDLIAELRYAEASPMLEQALAEAPENLPLQERAQLLRQLKEAYSFQPPEQRRPCLKSLLGDLIQTERARDAVDAALLQLYDEWAELWMEEGAPAEAEARYREALELQAQQVPYARRERAYLLQKLALVFEAQERFGEAFNALEEALSIEDGAGCEPGLMLRLARLNRHNAPAQTETLLKQAIGMLATRQACDRVDEVRLMLELATFYQEENRWTEASPLLRQALDHLSGLASNRLGDELRTRTLLKLARTERALHHHTEALQHAQAAWEAYNQLALEASPQTALYFVQQALGARHLLADILAESGDWSAAMEHYRALHNHYQDEERPIQQAQCLRQIARGLEARGERMEAQRCEQDADRLAGSARSRANALKDLSHKGKDWLRLRRRSQQN